MIISINAIAANRQSAQVPITGILPMNTVPVYELNSMGTQYAGASQLFDGVLNKQVNFGYGKVNPVDVFMFELYNVFTDVSITKIRLYQYEGGESNPTLFYTLTDFDATPVEVASFNGDADFEQWIEYDITESNIKYIQMVVGDNKPSQMEVTGTYTPLSPPNLHTLPFTLFKQLIGANMFEWQILNNDGSGVNSDLLTAMETFAQVRHYLDWDKIEHVQGEYCFEPSSSGDWDYDVMYTALSGAGITVLTCIKSQPAYMMATYPSDIQDNENAPVFYVDGAQNSKLLASSYVDFGKVVFQFAGRYGSNAALDPSLLHPNTQPKQFGQPGYDNVVKVGLNVVKYIEVNNETDKYWKGLLAFQSAYEYGMNLSVCYDGHLNSMGSGIGIKNADPNMQVVMAGIANTFPDEILGMADWSLTNRGYREDGSINLPFDALNFHYYDEDPNNNQGICPEQSEAASIVAGLMVQAKLYNIPLFITETGYDDLTGSPIAAIAIGGKSIAEVKADWTIRTSLLYARLGVERVFFYEAYDDSGTSVIYGSSGLLDATQTTLRKPAGDYLYQALNLLNGYTFVSTSTTDGIIIDIYNNGTKNAYVLLSPTQTGVTIGYTLVISPNVTVYQPLAGSNTMTTVGTSKTFTVSETPIFVIED